MEQILDTYESANPFPNTLTREEIMRVVAKAYGSPPKLQKPEKLQLSRIDRLESNIDEIGQMTSKNSLLIKNNENFSEHVCQLEDEVKELKNQITQKDISLTSVKSEVDAKLEEMQALHSRVKELELDVSLIQKRLSEMDYLK
ncbi:6137_t:CDS:2, partial [Funneliformis geosporum]